MWRSLVGLADDQARSAAQRFALPVTLILVGAAFVILALAGFFAALFFWLAESHGPVAAALVVACLAFLAAFACVLPLVIKRANRPPEPATQVSGIAAALPKIAPLIGARPVALGALALAIAVGFFSRRSENRS
jgi:uncharacterized membrane protein (DUF485 family)